MFKFCGVSMGLIAILTEDIVLFKIRLSETEMDIQLCSYYR